MTELPATQRCAEYPSTHNFDPVFISAVGFYRLPNFLVIQIQKKEKHIMIIRKSVDLSKKPKLTKKQLKMLEEMDKASIVYDEDSPEFTEEELKQFKRVSELKRD